MPLCKRVGGEQTRRHRTRAPATWSSLPKTWRYLAPGWRCRSPRTIIEMLAQQQVPGRRRLLGFAAMAGPSTWALPTANATTGAVTLDQEDGSQVSFSPYVPGSSPSWCQASYNYCPDQPWTLATLEEGTDGSWTFVRDVDTQTTFDFSATGQLVSESDQAGDSLSSSSEVAGAGACPAAWPAARCGRVRPRAAA